MQERIVKNISEAIGRKQEIIDKYVRKSFDLERMNNEQAAEIEALKAENKNLRNLLKEQMQDDLIASMIHEFDTKDL